MSTFNEEYLTQKRRDRVLAILAVSSLIGMISMVIASWILPEADNSLTAQVIASLNTVVVTLLGYFAGSSQPATSSRKDAP
jgi:putative flippase GtrA